MAIKDFFWLSGDEYAARISTYPVENLKQQETVKTRQRYQATYTMSVALGTAIPSHGITVPALGYGARIFTVANKKLKLIEKELQTAIAI